MRCLAFPAAEGSAFHGLTHSSLVKGCVCLFVKEYHSFLGYSPTKFCIGLEPLGNSQIRLQVEGAGDKKVTFTKGSSKLGANTPESNQLQLSRIPHNNLT